MQGNIFKYFNEKGKIFILKLVFFILKCIVTIIITIVGGDQIVVDM